MKVSELKPLEKNPRRISPDQLKKLKASIESFPAMMELRPIVYDPDTMQVLGGNQRLAAIKALGMKDIPDTWVKPASELTDAEKRKFVIQDNHQSGVFDFEMLENDWQDIDLDEIGIAKMYVSSGHRYVSVTNNPAFVIHRKKSPNWKLKQFGRYSLHSGIKDNQINSNRVKTSWEYVL